MLILILLLIYLNSLYPLQLVMLLVYVYFVLLNSFYLYLIFQ
uniref:Uncharacterized protein n=1 Tax=Schistosoma curassoni TaxID=6186 RepID=A0A183L1P4_9TREM